MLILYDLVDYANEKETQPLILPHIFFHFPTVAGCPLHWPRSGEVGTSLLGGALWILSPRLCEMNHFLDCFECLQHIFKSFACSTWHHFRWYPTTCPCSMARKYILTAQKPLSSDKAMGIVSPWPIMSILWTMSWGPNLGQTVLLELLCQRLQTFSMFSFPKMPTLYLHSTFRVVHLLCMSPMLFLEISVSTWRKDCIFPRHPKARF